MNVLGGHRLSKGYLQGDEHPVFRERMGNECPRSLPLHEREGRCGWGLHTPFEEESSGWRMKKWEWRRNVLLHKTDLNCGKCADGKPPMEETSRFKQIPEGYVSLPLSIFIYLSVVLCLFVHGPSLIRSSDDSCSIVASPCVCVCYREPLPTKTFLGYPSCYMQMKLFDVHFQLINASCIE